MRICICGLHRDEVVNKVEKLLNVESYNINYPDGDNSDYKLFDYAAETFKYFSNKDVIFDGGVFDAVKEYSDSGWNDLQDEVIMSSICNLDKIIIVTDEDSQKNIDFYTSFKKLYDDKIVLIQSDEYNDSLVR